MICYDFVCDKCGKAFEGDFDNFEDYKKQEADGRLVCPDDQSPLRREYKASLHVPEHMKATSSKTAEYATHLMSNAKRPGGREKIYY